jgi:hypothetical protein
MQNFPALSKSGEDVGSEGGDFKRAEEAGGKDGIHGEAFMLLRQRLTGMTSWAVPECGLECSLPVDFPAMADFDHEHTQLAVLKLADDTVVADPVAPEGA